MQYAQLIFLMIIGIVFIIVGWLIRKKEMITLIHSYHYDKVSKTDEKPYTLLMGNGAAVIGTGIVFTGIVNFITQSGWGWIIFAVCFVVGLGFMIYAVTKYNR